MVRCLIRRHQIAAVAEHCAGAAHHSLVMSFTIHQPPYLGCTYLRAYDCSLCWLSERHIGASNAGDLLCAPAEEAGSATILSRLLRVLGTSRVHESLVEYCWAGVAGRFQLRCVLEQAIWVTAGDSITGELRLKAHPRQSYDVFLHLTGPPLAPGRPPQTVRTPSHCSAKCAVNRTQTGAFKND